jgi:L-aminopeptidase/D-esterase-like protein
MAIESITQIKGVYVGHATDAEGGTGCTVVVVPKGATGGVDVRGGAPATRETDLLRPEETVDIVNAVVLS